MGLRNLLLDEQKPAEKPGILSGFKALRSLAIFGAYGLIAFFSMFFFVYFGELIASPFDLAGHVARFFGGIAVCVAVIERS